MLRSLLGPRRCPQSRLPTSAAMLNPRLSLVCGSRKIHWVTRTTVQLQSTLQSTANSSSLAQLPHLVFAHASPAFHHSLIRIVQNCLNHVQLCIVSVLKTIKHFFQCFTFSTARKAGLAQASATPTAATAAAVNFTSPCEPAPAQAAQKDNKLSKRQKRTQGKKQEVQQQASQQQQCLLSTTEPMQVPSASYSSMLSVASLYGSAPQQRTAVAVEAMQQTPAYTALSSLSPLQRTAGVVLVLLAVLGSQVALYQSHRRVVEAEAERQREANANSLKLQKQRFRAALAFDAVHLELPGIKESDVDPSNLLAKVANSSQSDPMELEGAIRKEWLQFMSASKVGLVTDLWDAKNKACNDNGPSASRAQLEEMTRRVRDANKTAGSARYRSADNSDGSTDSGDDGWFLTKEDGVGAAGGSRRTQDSNKEAQEAQMDMESMEERAARRRARLADQFASDEDVASMWTSKQNAATSKPRPTLFAKAMPSSPSQDGMSESRPQRAPNSNKASSRGNPGRLTGRPSPWAQRAKDSLCDAKPSGQSLKEPVSTPDGCSPCLLTPAATPSPKTKPSRLTSKPQPTAGAAAGGLQIKKKSPPPGVLPDSVFGAAVPLWHPGRELETTSDHASGVAGTGKPGPVPAASGKEQHKADVVQGEGTSLPGCNSSASGNEASSSSSSSDTVAGRSRQDDEKVSGSNEALINSKETKSHMQLDHATALHRGGLSSVGYYDTPLGQLEQHMKQDAVMFVAAPEHTAPLLASSRKSSSSDSSSDSSSSGGGGGGSNFTESSTGLSSVSQVPTSPSTVTLPPTTLNTNSTLESSSSEERRELKGYGTTGPSRGSREVTCSCDFAKAEKVESSRGAGEKGSERHWPRQSSNSHDKSSDNTVDAEARLAKFMRRPTSRKSEQ